MRVPKPFFREQTKSYYLQLGKRQISLGKDEAVAMKKYHSIMATMPRSFPPDSTVAVLVDGYLDWTEKHREQSTYTWYRDFLESFIKFIGPKLTIGDLKPYHVTRWVDAKYAGTSDNWRHGAIRSIQRACNWAVKEGLLDHSPVKSVEKPTPTSREAFITPEQFEEMLKLVRGEHFKDFLILLWETGARPQEVRKVEARHVQGNRWVFEAKESKGKKKPRIIQLTDKALEITRRLMKKHPTGPLLRNQRGNPWTRDAIGLRFRRLKKKMNIPLSAYALRHGWATMALKRGVDPITVATLMGHSDTRMLERVYQHLNKDGDHLQKALLKIKGGGV